MKQPWDSHGKSSIKPLLLLQSIIIHESITLDELFHQGTKGIVDVALGCDLC
jgi:hypothetical protein